MFLSYVTFSRVGRRLNIARHREEPRQRDVAISWRTRRFRTLRDCFVAIAPRNDITNVIARGPR
jgi:hypothetical protein